MCNASERKRLWRLANPEKSVALRRKERGALKKMEKRVAAGRPGAMVVWASRKIINAIYDRAFDERMEVDHIVPLFGNDAVCGLHCEHNMQIITREHNRWKRAHRYEQDNNVDMLIFTSKPAPCSRLEDDESAVPFY